MKSLCTALVFAICMLLSSASIASAQNNSKIVLGARPTMQTAVIVVAQQNGLFRKRGLDVQMVRIASGRKGLEALLGGQLDLSFMAEYPPVIAAMQGKQFGVVATISKYVANRILSTSAIKFKSLSDLAGKKIGTTHATNVAYFAELLLKKAGVEANIVNVSPAGVVPALARGDIDAEVTSRILIGAPKKCLETNYVNLLVMNMYLTLL